MKKGRVKITNKLIADALGFPPDWTIEEIVQSKNEFDVVESNVSEMIISGENFPETNNRGDAENVEVIVHEKARTFEVKKI